ncbi:uncharacterized protein LOC119683639 [Teleopsis dalmanni]|uniref:uncharacterized protein LOC119683639 n=1 Tax=Teleopsis dalmanni TaxID=139649 RepID=UPI0018CD0990|nr:uncharacterized protein LOC119683639 [Teleopsis dalmanni]
MSQSNSDISESIDGGEESDNSSSSSNSDSSASSCSSSSSDSEQLEYDSLELAKITEEELRLPRGLCENSAIFKEFFSLNTWQLLPEEFQAQLQEYLPCFSQILLKPGEAAAEQQKTVAMLFKRELNRFGSCPLTELQRNLEEGNYRPDVLKLRQRIAKSKRRHNRFSNCERISQIAKNLFISRERLLRNSYNSPPDTNVCTARSLKKQIELVHVNSKAYVKKARKRYRMEILKLAKDVGLGELSSDEEYDIAQVDVEVKQHSAKTILDLAQNNEEANLPNNTDKCIYSTFTKQKQEVTNADTIYMDQLSKYPRLSNMPFSKYLQNYIRKKFVEPTLPEYDTTDVRLRDVYGRAQVAISLKRTMSPEKSPPKKQLKMNEPPALVPIKPIRKLPQSVLESKEKPINNADVPFDNKFLNIYQKLDLIKKYDNDPFSVMDNDIELQHEEVVAYSSSEDVMSPYVMGNDMMLSQHVQNDELPQNILQASKTSEMPLHMLSPVNEQSKQLQKQNSDFYNLPKLEPLTGLNKINKEKIKVTLQTSTAQSPKSAYIGTGSNQSVLKKSVSGSQVSNVSYGSNAELIQETHSCFFSLIRDFFCATPNHRMKFDDLKHKIDRWLCNPITALNDWYSQAESWSALILSAINFLAGEFVEQPEEYVPYIEYKRQLNIYQWIGAGRDSDTRLTSLCHYWMQRRNETLENSSKHKLDQLTGGIRRRSMEVEDGCNYDSNALPPPPPRFPTTWAVRPATIEEVQEFQKQERERFSNPHRAFTYRMHDYESVVGPVKGIYSQIFALTKARGHSMMIGDRPNFVTILTLVRDATARLPNGEGTRADISELLKCSQFINRDAADNVLQTIVSGALDRMHTEHDACVRYDPKRKIWIYLHRNRSEEEFERMHQQYQGIGKNKKNPTKKPKSKIQARDGSDSDVTTTNVLSSVSSSVGIISKATKNYNVPALVPAKSLTFNTINNKSLINQHHQPQQNPLPNCPPVPPLKYNIPSQKSLLKPIFKTQRPLEKVIIESNDKRSDQNTLSTTQRNLVRTITKSNTSTSATAVGGKQFSFSVPQMKNISSGTTPIIVATPAGIQTLRVPQSNASIAKVKSTTPTQLPTINANIASKKLALNKPIIINQVTQNTSGKLSVMQGGKPLQQQQSNAQQPQSFIIPINNIALATNDSKKLSTIANAKEQTRNLQAILVDDSQSTSTEGSITQLQQQTPPKNLIRLVSTINTNNSPVTKSVIASPIASTGSLQNNNQTSVQILGQRVMAGNTIRPHIQQRTASNVSIVANSAVPNQITQTGTAGTIVKMSPQAFAALQQKSGQHVIVKQTITNNQSRVLIGQTGQTITKGGGTQQLAVKQKTNVTVTQTSNNVISSTIGTQLNAKTNAAVTATNQSGNKIQTISTANLTLQQQRALFQNLKQQQQLQFKTVHVVAPQQQQQHQQPDQPKQHQTQNIATASKPVTIVSQQQNIARLLKPVTTTQQQQQQQQQQKTLNQSSVIAKDANNTRVLASSTGQIISLEELLQKQGNNTIKLATSLNAKPIQGTNIIQLATPTNTELPKVSTTQFAVVSQPKNVISLNSTQRLITTQPNTTSLSATIAGKEISKIASNTITSGRMLTNSPVQNTKVAQLTNSKTLNKSIGENISKAAISPAGSSNIRVINTNSATGINIASLQGKQIVFAAKPVSNVKNITAVTASQAQQLQNAGIILSGQTVKIQGGINTQHVTKGSGIVGPQTATQSPTIVMGNQILKVQQLPQITKVSQNRVSVSNALPLTTVANVNKGTVLVNTSNSDTVLNTTAPSIGKTIVLNSAGQPLRMQSSQVTSQGNTVLKTVPSSRVVLTVQGGGQMVFSPSIQGGSLNLKQLQNMKVVSLASMPVVKDPKHQNKITISAQQQQQVNQQTILKSTGSGSIGS